MNMAFFPFGYCTVAPAHTALDPPDNPACATFQGHLTNREKCSGAHNSFQPDLSALRVLNFTDMTRGEKYSGAFNLKPAGYSGA